MSRTAPPSEWARCDDPSSRIRRNPVRTNVLENTGAYLWQTAAWVAGASPARNRPAELKRASPPLLLDAYSIWASKVSPDSIVQWSSDTHVTADTQPPLLSRRGSAVAIAVNTKAKSFIEIPTDVAALLESPTEIADLPQLTDYGRESDVADVAISLVRHGLLKITPRFSVPLWGIRLEPFVKVTAGEGDVMFVTKLLTGRFLRVDVGTANIIDSLCTPAPVAEPLNNSLRTLVGAGVLRLVGEL